MYNNELCHHGILGMKWGVRRYQNKDGSLTPAGKKRTKTITVHEDYATAHRKKSVTLMSDAELKARNNRLQLEQTYRNLTKKESAGKKFIKGFISTASTIAAIGVAYGTYEKLGKQILDKIGKMPVK